MTKYAPKSSEKGTSCVVGGADAEPHAAAPESLHWKPDEVTAPVAARPFTRMRVGNCPASTSKEDRLRTADGGGGKVALPKSPLLDKRSATRKASI